MKPETTVAADGLENTYHHICIKQTGKTHTLTINHMGRVGYWGPSTACCLQYQNTM